MDHTAKKWGILKKPHRSVNRIDWQEYNESPWWIKEGLVGGPTDTNIDELIEKTWLEPNKEPLDGWSFCRINQFERLLVDNINLSELGKKGKELIDK